jgi:deoxyadenosine/deoxycytidine kinase
MVFAKMLFDNKHISLENYSIYIKWFDTFVDCFNVDKVVYVQTRPIVCYDRIQKRSRAGESNIELSYLTNCHGYHEDMLNTTLAECVCKKQLVLNGNIDMHERPDQLSIWISDVEAFILTSSAQMIVSSSVFDKETLSC